MKSFKQDKLTVEAEKEKALSYVLFLTSLQMVYLNIQQI